MFKRIFACAVCVVLLLSVCSQAVSARAATTTFTLSTTDGKVGETVTVSVSLSADSYFTNCTFYVHYDPSVVSFVSDSELTGPISPPTSMLYVMDHADQQFVKGAYVTVKGIKKAGVLLSLDFKVEKEAAMPFSISFDECVGVDENDSEFDVTYQAVPCTLNAHAAPAATTAAPAAPTTTAAKATTAAPTTPTAVITPGAITPQNPAAPQGAGSAAQSSPDSNVVTTMTVPVGQNPTAPAVIPTDAQGNTLPTTSTTIATDMFGNIITEPADVTAMGFLPTTTVPTIAPVPDVEPAMGVLPIILLVAACAVIAGGVTVAAIAARKKRAAAVAETSEDVPADEAPVEEAPAAQDASVQETPTDEQ